jgi:hypothetical protein
MHGSSSVPQEYLAMIRQYGGNIKETYGVPVSEIVEGIKHGVRKVNIDTDLRIAMTAGIRKVFAENPKEFDPRKYLLTPETANAASLSTPSSNLDSPLSANPRATHTDAETQTSVVTADKLEAFRKRREQTEAIVAVAVAPEEVIETEVTLIEYSIEEDSHDELENIGEEPQTEVLPEQTPNESKKSRPPMPSWDEIVRGTQSDDGEVF